MDIICVGIDVSEGKSTIAAFRWSDKILWKPRDVPHTPSALRELADSIKRIGEEQNAEVRCVMEHTGRYWLPIAQILHNSGLFVCGINPKLSRDYSDNKLRKQHTDKIDSKKLAKYGLHYWNDLLQYVPTEALRQKLKDFSRQLDGTNKLLTMQKNNLQAVVDATFPRVRKALKSKARDDGHIKWVDFVCTYFHAEQVKSLSADEFEAEYRLWCKERKYQFTKKSCVKIYAAALDAVPTLPFDEDTELLVNEIAKQLTALSSSAEVYRRKSYELASELPEFGCVMSMFGCGVTTGPQAMAEIGDPMRFHDRVVEDKKIFAKNQLAQFAGVASGTNQSGTREQQSIKASKKGSPHLRRTLYQIVMTYVKQRPEGDPIYEFIKRKKADGKPHFVVTTAAANKFLQRYYCKVRDYLAAQEFEVGTAEISVSTGA